MTLKICSLYKITNLINDKVYIGQAASVSKRWSDHRRAVNSNKPTQIIHHAMIKHGLDNFEFDVLASCQTQDDANELETLLVQQYESHIAIGKGYNATLGGMNAPKTEEWKKNMSHVMGPKAKEWQANENADHKAQRYIKVSNALRGRDRIAGSGMKKGFLFPDLISNNRKLTEEQVESILSEHATGISQRKLAIKYNVDRTSISAILKGKTYKVF